MRAALLLLLVVAKKKKATAPEAPDSGWEATTNDEGQRVQQLKVEAPSLSEEDQKNVRMPDVYRCDACHAVMHKLGERLTKARKKDMKSWEVVDVVDSTCVVGNFEGYGVKLLGGENRLSGPGIPVPATTLAPGGASIQMGGETWSARLATECKELVYDRIGEEELYSGWKSQGNFEGVCTEQGLCGAPKAKVKKEKKPSSKKEKAEKKKAPEPTKEKKSEKAPPARAKGKDALSWKEYVRGLVDRRLADAAAFDGSRRVGEWDKLLLGLSGKLGTHYAQLATELADDGLVDLSGPVKGEL